MRILIATNRSSNNQQLLCFGLQIAHHAGEPLTLLTVIEPGIDSSPSAMAELIERIGRQVATSPLDIRVKVREGRAPDEILHETREGAYDLVIIEDSPRRSKVRRWLPDSTVVSVAERAPCSVAIIKGKSGAIRRILLCDSGANGPTTAPPLEAAKSPSVSKRFAERLAKLFDGQEKVTVLHVMSQISAGPGVRGKQLRAGAGELINEHTLEGELLAHDVELLERSGISTQAQVRHGLVVDEILAEAQGGDYDLVVIGAPAGEGWRHFLLDDLARKIVEQMDRPVLVVR
jgi:nucleotide-binding universal stress UspA family protein